MGGTQQALDTIIVIIVIIIAIIITIAIIIVIIILIIGPLIGWETASLGDSPNTELKTSQLGYLLMICESCKLQFKKKSSVILHSV